MKHIIFLSILLSSLCVKPVRAQQFADLIVLKGRSIEVYFSPGYEVRAAAIALRVEKALTYDQQLLGFKPTVTLLVLSDADWNRYAAKGAVFGMPHYTDMKTLIVAAHDNAFWKSFVPPLDQLPDNLRAQVTTVYKTGDSSLSMQAFFDLLAIHELGHAFHQQAGLTMQRKWMGELFVNILLHTYVAENEPQSLQALTLFPKMVIADGSNEFKYTSLNDIQERYDEIGQHYPKNYGWYQCGWHVASARNDVHQGRRHDGTHAGALHLGGDHRPEGRDGQHGLRHVQRVQREVLRRPAGDCPGGARSAARLRLAGERARAQERRRAADRAESRRPCGNARSAGGDPGSADRSRDRARTGGDARSRLHPSGPDHHVHTPQHAAAVRPDCEPPRIVLVGGLRSVHGARPDARRRAGDCDGRAAAHSRQLQDAAGPVQHGTGRLQAVPELFAEASLPYAVSEVPDERCHSAGAVRGCGDEMTI